MKTTSIQDTIRNSASPAATQRVMLRESNRTIRNWVIGFVAAVLVNIPGVMTGHQNLLAIGTMLFVAAVVVWEIHKREQILTVPVTVEEK